MAGLVERLKASAIGAGVADLKLWIPPLPVAGATVRFTAQYVAGALVDKQVPSVSDYTGTGASLTQSTTAAQPALRVLNGRRTLRFDGVDDRLVANRQFSQPVTVFAVGAVPALPASGVVAPLFRVGNNSINLGVNSAGNPTMFGGISAGTLSLQVPVNQVAIFTGMFNGASSILGYNEVESAPLNLGTTHTLGDIRLGQGSDNAAARVDVNELIIFPRALTAAERTLVRATLTAAWRL